MKKILLILIAFTVAAACGDNIKPPKRPHPMPAVDLAPMHQISVME